MITSVGAATRPRYRKGATSSSSLLPVKGLHERFEAAYVGEQLVTTTTDKATSLKAAMVSMKCVHGLVITNFTIRHCCQKSLFSPAKEREGEEIECHCYNRIPLTEN
jgi:hypothetical protein